MFYIGIISGLIALFYPQEPMAKVDQLAETIDIIRFYYHHWMLLSVPLLSALLGHHRPSYKRVLSAPTILLAVMLFIMLNQIFQSELGFVPLRNNSDFFAVGYKNTSYIWGPGKNDAIGNFLAMFCPKFFKEVPAGIHEGELKYWPWFWLICPVYLLIPVLSFIFALPFDAKTLIKDARELPMRIKAIPSKTKNFFIEFPKRFKAGAKAFFESKKT